MKAFTYKQYGSPEVLRMEEIEKPTPKDNEVLVRIYATTVSSGDWRARSLTLPAGMGLIGRLVFGIFGPRQPILGHEFSGVIEAVGKDVVKFEVGDEVVGYDASTHAEHKTMSEDGAIVLKPANISFEEATAIPFGGTTALDFVKNMGKLQPGEKVLVVGASGATGSASVQLAKHFGAEVTGVCSTTNLALVKSVGADKVIDYKVTDFTNNGETYDMIVDTVGTAPWSRAKNSLTPTGRLAVISGGLKDMLQASFVSKKDGKKLISGVSMGSQGKLQLLVDMAAKGTFKPLIDRTYAFEHMIDAHAYVDTGRKKGAVVVTLAPELRGQQAA